MTGKNINGNMNSVVKCSVLSESDRLHSKRHRTTRFTVKLLAKLTQNIPSRNAIPLLLRSYKVRSSLYDTGDLAVSTQWLNRSGRVGATNFMFVY